MKNKFIEQVTAQIKNKTARTQIEQELESHILDKIDYYVEIGYPYEEAERRATEEMGNPEDTALPLNGLHSEGILRRIIYAAFAVILWIVFCLLCTKFSYQSFYLQEFHSIGIDFLSLAFAVILTLALITAHKRHDKMIVQAVIFLIILMCGYSVTKGSVDSVFCLFAPMLYAFVTIISQGFTGYIDCIFGYGYIPDSLKPALAVLSAVLMIIFIAWTVVLFVSIYRRERMRSTQKMIKPIKIVKSVISILLAVNFVVMAFATILAVAGLPQKIEDTKLERSMMIETVINWDTSKPEEELLSYLYGLGYKDYHGGDNKAYLNHKELYLSNSNNMLIISRFDYEYDDYQIMYAATTQFDTQPLIVQDDMTIGLKETSWMVPDKMNLQKFLEFDWSDKAVSVTHDMLFDDTMAFNFVSEDEILTYNFNYEGDEQTEFSNRSLEDYILSGVGHTMGDLEDFSSDIRNYDENYDDVSEKTNSQNLMDFMDEIMKNNK